MTGYKTGDSVKIVIEGVVGQTSTDNPGLWLYVEVDGKPVYIEPAGVVEVEVLAPPLPTEDGWYESASFPISSGYYFPYRLLKGRWSQAGTPSEERDAATMKTLMPLRRLVVAE